MTRTGVEASWRTWVDSSWSTGRRVPSCGSWAGWSSASRPDQTAADVQNELGLSAGSVSTSLRYLGEMGLVERVSRPGDRRIFYRLQHRRVGARAPAAFPRLQRDPSGGGQGASWPPADQANDRLDEMRDTWAFLEARSAELLVASQARRDRAAAPEAGRHPRPRLIGGGPACGACRSARLGPGSAGRLPRPPTRPARRARRR